MRIDIYSHSYMVSEVSTRQKYAVEQFCRTLIQYKMVSEEGKMSWKPDRVYASAHKDRRYYRFHINTLQNFLKAMAYNQIASAEIEKVEHLIEIDDDYKVDFPVKEIRPLGGKGYEKQPELLEHILNPGSNKILNLQTGYGKTALAMHAMRIQGLRTGVWMKGGLIERWVPDLEKTFVFKKGELLVIRGSSSLNAVMEMALENELHKIKMMMFSINTFSEYLKDYEENGVTDSYPVDPGQFYEKLKIGFGILDEGHQNPHQVMKMFTYMNIHKFLTLSATLDTRDPFMTKMYEVLYPRAERAGSDVYKAYIRAKAIMYQIRRPKAIRYTGFGGAYSHNAFEASLMSKRNKNELKNYIDLITWTIEENFIKIMEKGMKCIVFCGTVKMCTMLAKYYANRYKHLNVVRYVSEDPASNLQTGELIFSTVLSAGTGQDIPNLLCGIMTTAIDSQQSNEQTKGRTRPLRDWPDVDPRFVYFVSTSIPQHMKYHYNKQLAFSGLVLSHSSEQAPISV